MSPPGSGKAGNEEALTVSHNAWVGSRAQFAQWRDQLTLAAGYMIAVLTVQGQEHRLPLIRGQPSEIPSFSNRHSWAAVAFQPPDPHPRGRLSPRRALVS